MKKLMVTVLVTLVIGLFLSGCGTDVDVNWDEFFNEYYSECVQLCETCAEWAEICDLETYTGKCIDKHWYKGTRNVDCNAYIEEMINLINIGNCEPAADRCLIN